jgi:single-strand DNA-binding protein
MTPLHRSTTTEIQKMATKSTNSNAEAGTAKSRSANGTSVNRVILVGRLVADPELRTTASGIPVTTVRVATSERGEAQFHNVVLWRQLAEFASQYITKSRPAYIEGRLQVRTWEAPDGSKRRSAEIVADRFQTLSGSKAAGAAQRHDLHSPSL